MFLTRKLIVAPQFSQCVRYLSAKPEPMEGLTPTEDSQRRVCPNRLAGKTALITGSTDGIGRAIAKRFCQEGSSVIINSRNPKSVENTVLQLRDEGFTAYGIPCDSSKEEGINALVEQIMKDHNGLDILVSNVGANAFFGNILKCPEKLWKKTFDVNLRSHFLLTKQVVPHMLKKETPCSILYMSSQAGYDPEPFTPAYCVSKTGLMAMTKSLCQDLAHTNVRVNCLAPGLVNTKMTRPLNEEAISQGKPLTQSQQAIVDNMKMVYYHAMNYKDRTIMKRAGEPFEIAGAAAFLCSDDASYLIGETLVIAGGIHTRI